MNKKYCDICGELIKDTDDSKFVVIKSKETLSDEAFKDVHTKCIRGVWM